jgi:oligoribonuclease NrnB/cAMP/cGMP phosphodiesterase (DHH superfamily)
MDIVYYHKSCPDGWAAAYVASKKYPEAVLFPLDHGAEFDFYQVINKDVLMVDFSLRTREQNDVIASAAKSFHIYDHHKTAQAVLDGAPYATFDMKRSGAGLTWDYLFGKDAEDLTFRDGSNFQKPRPWYVDYVEDRDLWNWALPNSKEICAYLGTLEMTKADWEPLDNMEWAAAIGQGIGALAHINHYVREAVKQAQVGMLQGYETSVVNALYLNCSEIGNELAKIHPVSLTWFERHDGVIQFSLRSIGDIDVSAIAKSFNGGGHKNAAGFQLDLAHGRQLIDRILGRIYDDHQAV